MLEAFVVELGRTPDEFWELSWYEWGLWMLRLRHINEEKNFKHQSLWAMTREIWVATINVHMPKGKTKKGSDLIKLDLFDTKKESNKKVKRLTPEEVEAKFVKRKK